MHLSDFLIESEASDKAHQMGLVYAGYGVWKDKTGRKVAKTVNGKLVFFNNNQQRTPQTNATPSPVAQKPMSPNRDTAAVENPLNQIKLDQFRVLDSARKRDFVAKALNNPAITQAPLIDSVAVSQLRSILNQVDYAFGVNTGDYYDAIFMGLKFHKRKSETSSEYKSIRKYSLTDPIKNKEILDTLLTSFDADPRVYITNISKVFGAQISRACVGYSNNKDELFRELTDMFISTPGTRACFVPSTGQVVLRNDVRIMSPLEIEQAIKNNKLYRADDISEFVQNLAVMVHETLHATRKFSIANSNLINSIFEEGFTQFGTKQIMNQYLSELRKRLATPQNIHMFEVVEQDLKNFCDRVYPSETRMMEIITEAHPDNARILDELNFSDNPQHRDATAFKLFRDAMVKKVKNANDAEEFISLCERAGKKYLESTAPKFYFGTKPPEYPTNVDISAMDLSDVGLLLMCSHPGLLAIEGSLERGSLHKDTAYLRIMLRL